MSAVLLSTISPLADAKDNSVKNEHSRTTTNTNIQPLYNGRWSKNK
ncbi:Uncharacterised protein [Staphylococcus chromogenes]|nr:hypothetical protein GCM10008139_11330 [Staphylococcus chromogenes]SUM12936.1 Uncharacterised protein [Staphylococcus chromogenes]